MKPRHLSPLAYHLARCTIAAFFALAAVLFAAPLRAVDWPLAVDRLLPAAQYTQGQSYEALQRTWTDSRPLPSRPQLQAAWDEIVAERVAARSAEQTRTNRIRQLRAKATDGTITQAERNEALAELLGWLETERAKARAEARTAR